MKYGCEFCSCCELFLVNTSIKWEKWQSVHCSLTSLIYLGYVAAHTNCHTVPPTHKNILSHQQNHHGLTPIYMYLQSRPSVNFTGMLAFNTGMASVGDDFCSDIDTVSRALLLAMLQADQQLLRTMLKNYWFQTECLN